MFASYVHSYSNGSDRSERDIFDEFRTFFPTQFWCVYCCGGQSPTHTPPIRSTYIHTFALAYVYAQDVPVASIEAVAFATITYWLSGYNPFPDRFFIFLVYVVMVYFAMTALTRGTYLSHTRSLLLKCVGCVVARK